MCRACRSSRASLSSAGEVTGLHHNPCAQLDRFRPGLTAAVLGCDVEGQLVRKAGIMAVGVAGDWMRAGNRIAVELPAGPHRRSESV